MIAYVFLGVSGLGTGLVIVAVRYGYGPVDATRQLVKGSGVRRITARQLRHELRLTEHQLDGAGEYIRGLERDQRELSAELERRGGQCDDLKADLDKAGLRIAELEEQLRESDLLREANTALRSELANARKVSQLPPHGDTPPPGVHVVPLNRAPFALSPVKPS